MAGAIPSKHHGVLWDMSKLGSYAWFCAADVQRHHYGISAPADAPHDTQTRFGIDPVNKLEPEFFLILSVKKLRQVASAVGYLHSSGIIHADIRGVRTLFVE